MTGFKSALMSFNERIAAVVRALCYGVNAQLLKKTDARLHFAAKPTRCRGVHGSKPSWGLNGGPAIAPSVACCNSLPCLRSRSVPRVLSNPFQTVLTGSQRLSHWL
jgi:hypothetical protein